MALLCLNQSLDFGLNSLRATIKKGFYCASFLFASYLKRNKADPVVEQVIYQRSQT